ncbi:hypothetical protein ABMA27_014951 [Loxostege sticticalis]|uniref:Lipase domain-containing protein n=1 Tax=Loxostege sticticalis TaxID=481309 RepID=A0ABR3IAS1_LOXSC
MKSVLICVVICVLVRNVYSNNWTPFRSVLYSELITCDHDKTKNLDVSEVMVYFYDFQNNFNISYPIENAAARITSAYNLDTTRRLIFFVPGYKTHIQKNNPEIMRQTFKDVPNTYLIIVDHSLYTSGKGGRIESYERSVSYAYYIGRAVGKFLAGLHERGYPSKNIHCVGHSLGGQMLGYAGVTYFNMTSEKVWRITGLDPAGPCFSNALIDEQIRSGVADYVEVYHCNTGGLGTTAVLADTDFFFNRKGKTQPHCNAGFLPGYGEYDSAKCSHKACVRYWAVSVSHPGWYLAWSCDSYDDFKDGRCAANQVTLAGYWNPGNATGVFYVSTETYGVV